MTKTLLVMRHGKSDWASSIGSDHERLLNSRGQRAARFMGTWMVERGLRPDLLVSSTATRTRETAQCVLEAFGEAPRTQFDRALYLTKPEGVVAHLAREGGDAETILLVNHEPTCSALIQRLTGKGVERFPTAALARIDADVDNWADLREGCGTLAWHVLPRVLMDD